MATTYTSRMLFEFHRQQNAKKPGIIHATYLLSGTKREELETPPISEPISEKDGEDDHMQSSPFMGSSLPQPEEETVSISTITISLVREEDLAGTVPSILPKPCTRLIFDVEIKSRYETITSIHIYSLGPHPLKDLRLLSDSTREIQTLTVDEDPIEDAKTYGMITNPIVRRRANRPQPPVAALRKAPAPAAKAKPLEPTKEAAKSIIAGSQDGKGSQSAAAKDFFGKGKEKIKPTTGSGPSSKESTPAPPAKLKKETSSIFKSFAKAKPKLVRENTDSAAEDVSMMGMDDDDDDGEESYDLPPTLKEKTKAKAVEDVEIDAQSQKVKKALEDMMDMSDEEEVVPTPEPEEEEEETILEKVKPAKEPESTYEVSGGRRRGKRRVMRKKTVKDEEGYLGMLFQQVKYDQASNGS